MGGAHGFSFGKLMKFAGPSLLMSAAFMDPGNLESDLQLGAQTGYKLLWVLVLATLVGYLIQQMAAKLGTVTGKDLAQLCWAEYPPAIRFTMWIFMELGIIGADIQEVVGSAIALGVLSSGHIPLWAGSIISVVAAFALLYLDELGHRVLEGVFAALVSTMAIAFLYIFWQADAPPTEVTKGLLIPGIKADQISVGLGVIGSIVMPFNIFLHSGLVQSRNVDTTSTIKVKEAIFYFNIESAFTVLVTFLVNGSIICVFAAGFFGTVGADEIGLRDAARVLSEKFGSEMKYIWAIGMIAAGQAAVMAGGMAGQFVMLGFLNLKVSKFQRLLYSRVVALVPTLLVVFLCHDSHSLDVMSQLLNIWQSIVLPFALIPLLVFTSSTRIVGQWKNSMVTLILSLMVAILIMISNAMFISQSIIKVCSETTPLLCSTVSLISISYFAFLMFVIYASYKKNSVPLYKEVLGESLLLLDNEDNENP